MYEIIRVSNDGLSFKLIDKNQRDLLSSVHGNFNSYNNIEYFEIVGTYSKLERNGFLTYLFEILVYEFDYQILSDSQHSSPGSKEFWQAHMKRKKFSIYRLNLNTNFKRNANRFDENAIWGNANSYSYDDQYYIEDDIHIVEDYENLDDLNIDSTELDGILDPNDFTSENLNLEIENQDVSFENIRLVAQKYVN